MWPGVSFLRLLKEKNMKKEPGAAESVQDRLDSQLMVPRPSRIPLQSFIRGPANTSHIVKDSSHSLQLVEPQSVCSRCQEPDGVRKKSEMISDYDSL